MPKVTAKRKSPPAPWYSLPNEQNVHLRRLDGRPRVAGDWPALHAAEKITLRNGFNLLCDHREQAGDRVRLFTSPDSGNFVEVDAAEIAAVGGGSRSPSRAHLGHGD